MAIPDFQTVMRPVLAAVSSAPLTLSEVRERIADEFQLTEEERNERLPSGKQTVINNRVGWARTYLNKAGLLSIPGKGLVQITERGLEVLANGPGRATQATGDDGIDGIINENNLGCSVKQVYEVKQFDSDYFNED